MIQGLLGLNLTGSGIQPECKDKGCRGAFGGAGECVELGVLTLKQLSQKFVFVFVCLWQIWQSIHIISGTLETYFP
jgi:hypothetical protein